MDELVDQDALRDLVDRASERYGPEMWSEEWHDFVMGQFMSHEVDKEGSPFVFGLRRVARKLLGPILSSGVRATHGDGVDGVRVEYEVEFLWTRPEDNVTGGVPPVVKFGDVADVTPNNAEPEFARFASALAATRAESRCLRKALQLRKCGAEEKTSQPVVETKIRASDILFIDAICRSINVDVHKFVNFGKTKFKTIDDVSAATASQMLEYLCRLQNNTDGIPPDLLGYKPDYPRGKR
jgi:hypothetical protein